MVSERASLHLSIVSNLHSYLRSMGSRPACLGHVFDVTCPLPIGHPPTTREGVLELPGDTSPIFRDILLQPIVIIYTKEERDRLEQRCDRAHSWLYALQCQEEARPLGVPEALRAPSDVPRVPPSHRVSFPALTGLCLGLGPQSTTPSPHTH